MLLRKILNLTKIRFSLDFDQFDIKRKLRWDELLKSQKSCIIANYIRGFYQAWRYSKMSKLLGLCCQLGFHKGKQLHVLPGLKQTVTTNI